MNIVIVNDTGVDVFKKWSDVKKYTSFTKEDFTPVGADFFLTIDNESYEISKDIKLLERVASERVFAKQKMSGVDYFAVLSGVMTILIYFSL